MNQRRHLDVGRRRSAFGILVCGALAVAMLGVLTGCGLPGWIRSERTLKLPGPAGERTTIVYHPSSAKPGAPLVIVLHGAGGTGEAARGSMGWDDLAERHGFVVAYPDALDGRWNAGKCCRRSDMPKVDDVDFMRALRDRLIARDRVDPLRVYAVGASNGGMLALAWACSRPGELAAIGVVSGTLGVPCPAPAPLTVVAIHGTNDRILPIDGGRSPDVPGWTATFLSLEESLAPFRTAAGCPSEPQVESLPPATVATWRCAAGRTVVRDVIEGAAHGWPGSGGRAGSDSGPLDSTGFLWSRLHNARATPSG